jgi:hypothetical protein
VGILEAIRRFCDEPEMCGPVENVARTRVEGDEGIPESSEDFWKEFYRVNDSSDRKND